MTNQSDPLYSVWKGMKQRCYNPNTIAYHRYGGRGIFICERWHTFENFSQDMGKRPEGMTIDRIDNDGPYSPENCRWVTQKENMRNNGSVRFVDIEGITYKVCELAEKANLKRETIISRANKGLSLMEILSPERRVFKDGLALGGLANGERQKSKTHCPQGHEYTDRNTVLSKEGWRRCRVCINAKGQRRRDKLK